MDVLEKAKRIQALADYIEYKKSYVPLNYSLNNMVDSSGKGLYIVQLQDIYDNVYQIAEDSFSDELIAVEAEKWERIVSDVYTQFYSAAFSKAQKKAIEKITIAEVEQNIKKYENR